MKKRSQKEKKPKVESPSLLYYEYDWYEKLFPLALQKSADGFFFPGLRCELIGVSKNINLLQTKDSYFVTKVRIDQFYDMYMRMSSDCIAILLNKGLGRAGRPFNIDNISELEKAVLTGFNDYVSRIIIPFLEPPPVVNFVRTNFDMTQLTFLITDAEQIDLYGKFILSVPDGRLSPDKIEFTGDKFDFPDFYECPTDVRLVVGKTRFSVDEMKSLEAGDLIILEDSELSQLTLYVQDDVKTVYIEPNREIMIPFDNAGGAAMGEKSVPKNLWDTIEVDMYAELDPVKISLGNLKKIELGQVVDVAAIYENHITLRVENKVIGHGELVIVNDRYGVKISEILQKKNPAAYGEVGASEFQSIAAPQDEQETSENETQTTSEAPVQQQAENPAEAGSEEEFDYSDFELEDEDI